MTQREELILTIKETLESSSIHAIPNITRNKNYSIKLMWSICFLISFTVCSFSIYSSLSDFFNYDVTTKIIVQNQDKLKFPIISICNLNFYSTNESYLASKLLFGTDSPEPSLTTRGQVWTNLMLESLYGIDKRTTGYSVYDTLISCQFNLAKCNLSQDFEYFYDVTYGNCFRFNSGNNMNGSKIETKYTYQSGVRNALDLELFIGSAELNNYPFSRENGFLISISNDIAYSISSTESVKISAGMSTNIILKAFTIKKQPKPYSECTEDLTSINSYDSECYRELYLPNRKYFYSDCNDMCFQKYLGELCACQTALFSFSYYKNMRFCSGPELNTNKINPNDSICVNKAFREYALKPELKKKCNCPLECETNSFSHAYSISEDPTIQYSKFLMNQSLIKKRLGSLSYIDLKQNVARVQIFYNELKETFISEEIKTKIFDLVSNIGGTLGLFLGLSFLSLIEFFEIFFQILIISLFKRKNQNKIEMIGTNNKNNIPILD